MNSVQLSCAGEEIREEKPKLAKDQKGGGSRVGKNDRCRTQARKKDSTRYGMKIPKKKEGSRN